ncbi:MAG: InlB B-repeat-containing protein, partial [Lachnospiraceae bacterium]|nr:InlB B-repeat-containing protein [Lachnospiraceae bacterium]
MKQTAKKICAALLVLCMLAGVMPLSVLATDGSGTTQVVNQQLSLGDDLTMRFYVAIDDAYVADGQMTVSVGGVIDDVYNVSELTAQDGQYVFSVDLAAAQMTEDIMLTLTSGEETVLEKDYSIQDYAHYLLEGNYTDTTKNLVKKMLNYGAKAQSYFGVKTDDMANAGYQIENLSAITDEVSDLAVSDSVNGVAFYGATLLFQSKLAIRYYFTAANGTDGLTFKVGETVLKAEPKDDLFYVEVADINPQDLNTAKTVTVSDGTDTMSVSYNPMNYIVRMTNKESSSDALKELLFATYGYHKAAAAYVGIDQMLTVSFSDGIAAQSVEYGACVAEPAVSKEGYYFEGWYNGDVAFDFTQPITSSISLTAKWEAIPDNMWYDFYDESCTSIWKSDALTLSWLESYDGEEGVLKIDKPA